MHSELKIIRIHDEPTWDAYVYGSRNANHYHLYSWQKAIFDAYGFKTYALAAISGCDTSATREQEKQSNGKVVGILPLVHLKSILFGNRLISLPYFDHGGIAADNQSIEKKLVHAAALLGNKLNARRIELRQMEKIKCFSFNSASINRKKTLYHIDINEFDPNGKHTPLCLGWSLRSHKVRLVSTLADSSEDMMKAFKSKLRSQIKRPIKAGLIAKIGGIELINDFYKVFSINMRDLGSPVHSKRFVSSVVENFDKRSRIVAIYKKDEPVAASIMVGYKDLMINPWASSLRKYSKLSPNMLLYWSMLEYACDHGYRYFDFGRSSPNEGTFKFKTQWGAKPQSMYWYTIWLNKDKGSELTESNTFQSKKHILAVKIWSRLPISLSRLIGPIIRKNIDL